jgi:hypothetical protein
MAEDDPEKKEPSLELPRLGLRRRPRAAEPAEVEADEEPTTPEPAPPQRQRQWTRPTLAVPVPGGMVAAVLTGLVVGLGLVGLTWAGLRTCESVQGTTSCGNSGYPLLVAILVAMVVVGGALLKAAHVPDPWTTSFLAVGLTAVIALLIFIDSLTDRSMIVIIPVLSAACFALAHWITRTFIDPADG